MIASDDAHQAGASNPPSRRAVLLGAGHAHLDAIRHARSFTSRGFELVVVAPGPFWYSGLATGMLGGSYSPEEDQVDVARLVERGGGRFIRDCAQTVDPSRRTVTLNSGPPLEYDVASLNLGSEVPLSSVPGLAERAIPVKPIANLWRLHDEVISRVGNAAVESPQRIVVVGGGATACEVTANLCGLVARSGTQAMITLLARDERLMRSWPEQASAIMSESLRGRGVTILLGSSAARVEEEAVFTSGGETIAYDLLVAAHGLVPPPLIRATGLPTDQQGGLLVDEHLRSVADPAVFGGGDCIALLGHDLARVGVHGVRQGPILRHNLIATLQGRPRAEFRAFHPQRRFLQILNLGDGKGLATRGRWVWHGKLALMLKDWIDRRFLATYR
jgi:NADH dehydrogenase FAD-containing subunit